MLSQKRRPHITSLAQFRMHHLLVGVSSHAHLSPSWPLLLKTNRNLVTSEFLVPEPRTQQVKSRADSWLLNTQTGTKRSSNKEECIKKRTRYIYINEKLRPSRRSLELLFPFYQLRCKLPNKGSCKICCFPVPSKLAFLSRNSFRAAAGTIAYIQQHYRPTV
jgi:hypothetical protein